MKQLRTISRGFDFRHSVTCGSHDETVAKAGDLIAVMEAEHTGETRVAQRQTWPEAYDDAALDRAYLTHLSELAFSAGSERM